MKRSVTVEVAGQKLTLRTDADEAYVKSLAEFVSLKMGEVRAASRAPSTHVIALLAALRIADDLFQAEKRERELREKVRQKSRRILKLLESDAEREN